MLVDQLGAELQTIGSYELAGKVADGGMATVYKGRHRFTGEWAAIKVVPAHLASNRVFVKRFEQEYNAARLLNHPNIVKALEFGYVRDLPYLVMEFVEGESVGKMLQRSGRLSENDAIKIIAQVAQGLHKAHKLGVIHRDVKPENVLVTADGTAKLVDLGLVKEIDAELNLTRTNRGLGTPFFMAPEQFRNAKSADARCDIYSMAATLYTMVTGEMPYKAYGPLEAWMKKVNNDLTAPRTLVPNLSERVDWAIRRSMSSDPSQRAASCREFVEDLTGRSTRRLALVPGAEPVENRWYLVFQDEEGVVHTVKGSTKGIRRSLKEQLLGDATNVRASRAMDGPFEPLRQHPEFRDLVVDLLPASRPGAASNAPVSNAQANASQNPAGAAIAGEFQLAALASTGDNDGNVIKPLLDVKDDLSRVPERGRWLLLVSIAVTTGIAGYFAMKLLASLRWL